MSATPTDPADYAFHHWRKFETTQEHTERVEAAEATAGRYFASATAKPLQAFHDAMAFLRPFRGPVWDRRRAAAQAAWEQATAGARELFNITADEIMRDGEVSEATSLAWDVLAEQAERQPAAPSFPVSIHHQPQAAL
ncbi:hypothetical protein A1D31_14085 [Bradyrhizobium liaoningense]|nr:hypothetical protein A1D31_14085 [Bradyrhizobium liaoningense]